ncbi:MAG: preprotein translocase subunit SecG [Bacteroidales bacterium]|nr:preprotein translocase subunit SecG [Porphyromonas sp.]MDD6934610.1 preprotein translocase subunit SecG [Bacteroidales bacterium]MDY3101800.1 preprotein translocase subunit SecG [Porphyromonas sp.]
MFIFLSILILLAAVLLSLVVVIQNSKGGGLASGFASSNQIMGVRKTTDFLEKATWWLAGAIAILSIVSTHFLHASMNADQGINAAIEQQVEEKPEQQLPALGGEAPQTPTLPDASQQ